MQGKELVSTIQAVLEVQTRAEQRELVQKMTSVAAKLLENSGIEIHSNEVFDFLRTVDKQHGFSNDPDSQDIRRGVIANRLRFWGINYLETAAKLGEKLDLAYAPIRTALFRSRSRSAHVGAVLRPFRQRYLDIWAEALGDKFDREWVLSEVQRLSVFPVETEIDLYRWSDSVFELFRNVAIIQTPEKGAKQADFKKPLGMIGSNSEKTYKQQWELWMKRNAVGLLTGNFKYHAPTYVSPLQAFNQAPRLYISDYGDSPLNFQRAESEPADAVSNSITEGSGDKVTLRIESVDHHELSAQRTWLNRHSAINELKAWVSSMALFWGGDEIKITIELELSTSSGESKFKLPPLALGAAGETIVKALSTYR